MMKNLRLLFAFSACLLLVAAMLFLTAVGGSATTDDIGLAHISSAPEAADKPPASDIETQPRKQVEGPSSKLGTVTPDGRDSVEIATTDAEVCKQPGAAGLRQFSDDYLVHLAGIGLLPESVRSLKLSPKQIAARRVAVDPDNKYAYPGRSFPVSSSSWSAEFRGESLLPKRVSSDSDSKTVGRLSDRFSDIELVDQHGRKLKFYSDLVKDQLVIVSFFYTRCEGICAPTNFNLAKIRELAAKKLGQPMRIISISLDPDFDTPEVLQEYANLFNDGVDDVSSVRWHFLTGDYKEITKLRKELGIYDLDPVIDLDRSQHAELITYGNDRTDRWSAIPSTLPAATICGAIKKIAGCKYRDPAFLPSNSLSEERWLLTGPLTAVSPWEHQLAVAGTPVFVPEDLRIDGTAGMDGGDIRFLVDSNLHHGVRNILPRVGQMPAMVTAMGGYDQDGRMVADHMKVDIARHTLSGLISYREGEGLRVADVTVMENPDLRFPMRIVDRFDNPIPASDLQQCLGEYVVATGYYLERQFYATELKLDWSPPAPRSGDESPLVLLNVNLDVVSGTLTCAVYCEDESDELLVDIFDAASGKIIGSGVLTPQQGQLSRTCLLTVDGVNVAPHAVQLAVRDSLQTTSATAVNYGPVMPTPDRHESVVRGPVETFDAQSRRVKVNGQWLSYQEGTAFYQVLHSADPHPYRSRIEPQGVNGPLAVVSRNQQIAIDDDCVVIGKPKVHEDSLLVCDTPVVINSGTEISLQHEGKTVSTTAVELKKMLREEHKSVSATVTGVCQLERVPNSGPETPVSCRVLASKVRVQID